MERSLREYVMHKESCKLEQHGDRCTCGLAALLSPLAAAPVARSGEGAGLEAIERAIGYGERYLNVLSKGGWDDGLDYADVENLLSDARKAVAALRVSPPPGETAPSAPVAWLFTNQDGGRRIVFGDCGGDAMADEAAVPILADHDRSYTLAGAGTTDTERLDWLEGELGREAVAMQVGLPMPRSLFRENLPITRRAIDAARAVPPTEEGTT